MNDIYSPGYLSADEIQNVFTHAKTLGEQALFPMGGRAPTRQDLIHFLDELRHELLRRCNPNRPTPAAPKAGANATSAPQPPGPDSRAEYQAYRQGLARS